MRIGDEEDRPAAGRRRGGAPIRERRATARKRAIRGWAAGALAACLGACAASPPPPPAASPAATADAPIRYACDDGGFLSVRFTAEGADVVQADGERAVLARRPSGAGFLYVSERFALRGAGDLATWTEAGGRPAACQAT